MTTACPECGSQAYKKNGYTRHGKQNHRCLECGRQFSCDSEEGVHSVNFSDKLVAVQIDEGSFKSPSS